ncbi:DUF2782 domain-containing protein [Dyella ginsengisoli]|uniref:DUF2782 domain-containing protein n=1 Tax=Dyella ginsengisoli TaxID=363848 RepID=UPI000349FB4C|nr:DUF2782 domain-containing protein [Dyella ginsengisoli]
MSARLPLALATLLLAAQVHAQDVPSKPDLPALPPPGLNDPGVNTATAPAPAKTAPAPESTPAELTPTHLPGKPIPLPRAPGDNRPTEAIPEVSVHRDGDKTVQEYRRSGRLYMVVVTPKNGIEQTYMVDPNGRWVDEHGQKPVGPVMYKILEWGKAPPPAGSGDDSGDGGSH